jgi:hypothetical protein
MLSSYKTLGMVAMHSFSAVSKNLHKTAPNDVLGPRDNGGHL